MSSPTRSAEEEPTEGTAVAAVPAVPDEAKAEEPPPLQPVEESERRTADDAAAPEEGAGSPDGKPAANAAAKQEENEGQDDPPSDDGACTNDAKEPASGRGAGQANDEPTTEKSKDGNDNDNAPADDDPPSPDRKRPRTNQPVVAHQPKSRTGRPPPVDTSAPPVREVSVKKEDVLSPMLDDVADADVKKAPQKPGTRRSPPSHPPTGPPGADDDDDARTWSETIFPMKLYDILCSPAFRHAVTWMPHGRSWKVLDKDAFIREICPRYFAQTRYESFIRQVNGWGFKRLRREGPDKGSYYHRHFLRGFPHLIDHMHRPAPGEKSRDLMEEPNLSVMPPLPMVPPPDPSRTPTFHPAKKVGRPVGSGQSGLGPSGFDPCVLLPPTPTGGVGYYTYPPPMSPGAYGGPGAGPGPLQGTYGYPMYGYPPPPTGYPYGPPPGTPQGEGAPGAPETGPFGAHGAQPMMPQGPGMPPGAPGTGPGMVPGPGMPPGDPFSVYSYPHPPMYGDPRQLYAPLPGAAGGPPPPGTPGKLPPTPGSESKHPLPQTGPLGMPPPGTYPSYYPYPGGPPPMMPPGMGLPGAPGMPPEAPGMPTGPPGVPGPPDSVPMPPGGGPMPPQQDAQGESGPYTTL